MPSVQPAIQVVRAARAAVPGLSREERHGRRNSVKVVLWLEGGDDGWMPDQRADPVALPESLQLGLIFVRGRTTLNPAFNLGP